MSQSIPAKQGDSLPFNHHLHQFLTFLKHERGFADATIVNREGSLKPFLGWLVAQDLPLSAVSPVVITKYFTIAVAGRWKRTTISFHVSSLRSFFRFATNRGWCAAGIAESIDAPRVYTYENLPQGPTWEEVKKLVTSVNDPSPVQIRNRCAILLCSVYGLRVARSLLPASQGHRLDGRKNLRAPSQTEENPDLSPDDRGWECTFAVSEGGEATVPLDFAIDEPPL